MFMFLPCQQARSCLVEPIDFEEYLLKNKVLLNNDPVREMLLVPPDVVQVCKMNLKIKSLN